MVRTPVPTNNSAALYTPNHYIPVKFRLRIIQTYNHLVNGYYVKKSIIKTL